MAGRNDTHQLVVSNTSTGERFSFVGSKKECEEAAAEQERTWKKANCEIDISPRKG